VPSDPFVLHEEIVFLFERNEQNYIKGSGRFALKIYDSPNVKKVIR
jgi:hypothetical protein